MSADDDTFEIDIYGDDAPEPEPEPEPEIEPTPVEQPQQQNGAANANSDASAQKSTSDVKQEPTSSATPQQHGTKRKAPEDDADIKQEQHADQSYDDYVDNRPIDAGAMPALKLAELHWWTTEEDVRGFCARAGAEEELHEISFGEHKINGKSKGEAYLEFDSPQAATAVKREIETASQLKNESGARKSPFTAFFAPLGNPFKTAAGAGSKKDFGQSSTRGDRGGAYNSFNNRGGGNFGGRGNFNNRGSGGGGFNNGMRGAMGGQQQAGWGGMNGGMNGGMGGYGGGFGANPMMGMPMGGYGNMGRGGMMGNMGGMMGRGGFGGMGMGNMNMGMMGGGGGSRGGMMGGRGGWNGGGGAGFNAGFGGGGVQQNDPNKRMKMG